jgi:hypothetical protein
MNIYSMGGRSMLDGKEIKVAVIGLDTSHSVVFTELMQSPDCPAEKRVPGLRTISCLRFPTPFQSEEGLDARQKQMEGWGVKVTTDFDEAVADCDAIMLEINDPAYHLDYFKRCADLGKPIFLDKPMAGNIEDGRKIYDLAKSKSLKVFSTSTLRFVPQLLEACIQMPEPYFTTTYGPLGVAPAGSSIVWYGVHSFEMLQRAMGAGAAAVKTVEDKAGVVSVVEYADGRRGVVELTVGAGIYGGCLRSKEKAVPYVVDMSRHYPDLLLEIEKFFRTGKAPISLGTTFEVMAMLDAAERSFKSGKTEAMGVA